MKAEINEKRGIVMAKTFVTLACILTACASCKDSEISLVPVPGSENPPPAATPYPNPAPSGIYDPATPQPYPVYHLAAGWLQNQENPWQSRKDKSDVSFDLGVLTRPEPNTDAESWRDLRFNHVFCQIIGEKDVAINCDKGFKKENLQLAGKKIYLLHYYGVQGNLDTPVTEAFWDGTDWPEALVIEGNFQEAKEALVALLKTLHYRYR